MDDLIEKINTAILFHGWEPELANKLDDWRWVVMQLEMNPRVQRNRFNKALSYVESLNIKTCKPRDFFL